MKKYKSIFWFSLIVVLVIFSISLISIKLAQGSVANIVQIVFSNEPLLVPTGEVSEDLNIQTQNSAGLAEALDETADLTLTSTSATGEFSISISSTLDEPL